MTNAEIEGKRREILEHSEPQLKAINHLVSEVIAPQTQAFWENYHDYLKDISTNAGVLLGGVVAVWSTNIVVFNRFFILAGFVLLALSLIISFSVRKKAATRPTPYILKLREISNQATNFSANIVGFSRQEISIEDFKEKATAFDSNYHKWRYDSSFEDLIANETAMIKRMNRWYSEINIINILFLGGIVLIILAVLMPAFCLK